MNSEKNSEKKSEKKKPGPKTYSFNPLLKTHNLIQRYRALYSRTGFLLSDIDTATLHLPADDPLAAIRDKARSAWADLELGLRNYEIAKSEQGK
jgi:hypothetical protein